MDNKPLLPFWQCNDIQLKGLVDESEVINHYVYWTKSYVIALENPYRSKSGNKGRTSTGYKSLFVA
jgi:hypothetical protein